MVILAPPETPNRGALLPFFSLWGCLGRDLGPSLGVLDGFLGDKAPKMPPKCSLKSRKRAPKTRSENAPRDPQNTPTGPPETPERFPRGLYLSCASALCLVNCAFLVESLPDVKEKGHQERLNQHVATYQTKCEGATHIIELQGATH